MAQAMLKHSRFYLKAQVLPIYFSKCFQLFSLKSQAYLMRF